MVNAALIARGVEGGRLVDVGCGRGALWSVVSPLFDRYCGLDAVRYDTFPLCGEFRAVDLDAADWPIAAGEADVVTAIETIEHLENPWNFVRALVRIARPGGWVVITTPNQLSALSVLTLIVKQRFSEFQDSQYPAHRTALLESDLLRVARAAGLEALAVAYSHYGRLPLAAAHYPEAIARLWPRALSDNLLVIGRKPR
ncbi:MAG: SAM-dependent methyltransferase [Acidobacteria bacterium]|nr:MAG: SAM-dependent methyltransferase [Acidobacteriota bacterium]PYR11726.1 MAG: SAM-dependent methyltransferase [Acidobacteriota bacterium]